MVSPPSFLPNLERKQFDEFRKNPPKPNNGKLSFPPKV